MRTCILLAQTHTRTLARALATPDSRRAQTLSPLHHACLLAHAPQVSTAAGGSERILSESSEHR